MTRAFTTLLMSLAISSISHAEQLYELGAPILRGPGCPAGSASAVVSPDGSAISILFDRFMIQRSRGTYQSQRLNTNCTFTVPLRVARGYVLMTTSIDYRGFYSVPQDAQVLLTTSGPILHPGYRQVGSSNTITTQLPGGSDDIQLRHDLPQNRIGQCYGQKSIQFTTTLGISAPAYRGMPVLRDEANVMLDSADMGVDEGPISIGIQVVPCR